MANEGPIALAALVGGAFLLSRRSVGPAEPKSMAISSPTDSSGVHVPLGQSSPTNITPATEGLQPGTTRSQPGNATKVDRIGNRYSAKFDTAHTSGMVGPALPVTLGRTAYVVFDRAGQAYRMVAKSVSNGDRAIVWEFESVDIESQKISASGYRAATAIKFSKATRTVSIPWDKKPIDPVQGVSNTQTPWTQFGWWATQQRKFSQAELVLQARNSAHPKNEIGGFDLIPTPGIGIVSSVPGIIGDAVQGIRGLFRG